MRFFLVSSAFSVFRNGRRSRPAILNFKRRRISSGAERARPFSSGALWRPTKPELYIVWAKWPPGTAAVRTIIRTTLRDRDLRNLVVGTGTDYDMAKTVPMKAGSFIKHTRRISLRRAKAKGGKRGKRFSAQKNRFGHGGPAIPFPSFFFFYARPLLSNSYTHRCLYRWSSPYQL